jgi:hypothetical protein
MQIIFSREVAEELRSRYTVLELETFDVEDKTLETFCVIPADKMNLGDIPNLESDIRLHENLIEQLKLKNYQFCLDAIEHLLGKFGGELDSFYVIIKQRAELALEQTSA